MTGRPHVGAGRLGLTAALILLAAILGFTAWREHASAPVAQQSGQADIGGPFRMVDQLGRPADEHVLLGKWSAVFFGYTYCPDTCPATLQALAAAQTRLGPLAKTFQVVFVSVDPARDTPAQMKLYLSAQGFPQGALGLTGTPAQVAQIAKVYHAYYAKQGTGAQNYTVQHTAAIYLMNPKGQFVKPLDESQPPDALAAQIKEAMRN
ncbi:MAG: SCO family protein [Caulobacteraceae bacterium]